jgi:hypothetical protein
MDVLKAIQPRPGDANPQLIQLWEEMNTLEKLIELYNTPGVDLNASVASMSFICQDASPMLIDVKNLMSQTSGPAWKNGCGKYIYY